MKLEELKAQVKNCEVVINAGLDHTGWAWSEYRRLQKDLALRLLNEKGTTNERGRYWLKVDMKTLGLLNKRDFPEGTVIAVRKYRIWVKGLHTAVSTVFGMYDLKDADMPQYIHRFVF